MSAFRAQLASQLDWPALDGLRRAAEQRLRDKGVTQWQNTAIGLTQLACHLGRGDEMYLVYDEQAAVAGCFALTHWGDPRLWAGDPEAWRFLYLHKVITNPDFAHQGVGQFIVDYAAGMARQHRMRGVRLDCVDGNSDLAEHWAKLGFWFLRVTGARGGAVLMEMRTAGS